MVWWKTFYNSQLFAEEVGFHGENTTKSELEMIMKLMPPGQYRRLIDLACGYGRLSFPLAEKGYVVLGIDFSPLYIRWAKEDLSRSKPNGKVWFERADMRHFKTEAPADALVCMHTSFGYFKNDKDNAAVLKAMHCALNPGGKMLLDITNYNWVLTKFPDGKTFTSTNERGGVFTKEYHYDKTASRIRKKIQYKRGIINRTSGFNIRVYSTEEIQKILAENGFIPQRLFGDYSVDSPHTKDSQRTIILSERM